MNPYLLQTEVLDRALDAQALNDYQQQLLTNDTPEVDSVSEAIAAGDTQLATKLLDEAAEINRLERERERHIAGVVDEAVAAGRANARLGVTAGGNGSHLARQLAAGIDALERADNAVGRAIAAGALHRAIKDKPHSELLRKTVTYQLGEKRTHVLKQLLAAEVAA